MRAYSLKQISAATEKALSSITERAKNGRKNRKGVQIEARWVVSGKQGKAVLYAIDNLPADIRAALTSAEYRALSRMLKRLNKAIQAFDSASGGEK